MFASDGVMPVAQAPQRLFIVDGMRGMAALAVCWFHFTGPLGDFLQNGWLSESGRFGWLGVEVFFVISGFIIPYALHRSGYQICDYGRFLLKRVVRLDPPYLATIATILSVSFLFSILPDFKSLPFKFSFAQFLLHLGYVNVFFDYPWYNPVFWTLAIEVQYYILMGLLYPAISSRSIWLRAALFVVLSALALSTTNGRFIFFWLPLFMLGMVVFQFHVSILPRCHFWLWLTVLGIWSWYINGPIIASTGFAAALIIALIQIKLSRPFLFLGDISYSLYLLHFPFGCWIIIPGSRFVSSLPGKIVVLACALGTTIAAAWLLYLFVERPARSWSYRIKYSKRRLPATELVQCANSQAEAPAL